MKFWNLIKQGKWKTETYPNPKNLCLFGKIDIYKTNEVVGCYNSYIEI